MRATKTLTNIKQLTGVTGVVFTTLMDTHQHITTVTKQASLTHDVYFLSHRPNKEIREIIVAFRHHKK